MPKLHLYTAFHANLSYSSIPDDDHAIVIDRCYWPLVRMARELSLPLGLEFSGYTLERIAAVDPLLLQTLKELWQQGTIEVIGSGYAQTIFPLIPARANVENLRLGNEVYQQLLGRRPTVAYVNEQAFSRGLVDLYLAAGYEAVLMDWNNPAKFNRYDEALQYRPQQLSGSGGKNIRILWNHSISFQKFQRYVGGELSLAEELEYLRSHLAAEDRAFLLYGSDLEIFDYTPGERPPQENVGTAMARIGELLSTLKDDAAFQLISPSVALQQFPAGQVVDLASSEYPIPCKKQDKYNLTRWAVTGQEDTVQNTTCSELLREIENLEFVLTHQKSRDRGAVKELFDDLSYLWASDFRTYATPYKLRDFHQQAGALREKIDILWRDLRPKLFKKGDFILGNLTAADWSGQPVEFRMTFAPGRFTAVPAVSVGGEAVPAQFEDIERYQDGSLRSTVVVLAPTVPAQSLVAGEFKPGLDSRRGLQWGVATSVTTPAVQLELHQAKGASIKALTFPGVSDKPLVGYLPHGFYDDISLSAEWFTGDVVLVMPDGKQLTDLDDHDGSKTKIEAGDVSSFPIRVPVRVTVPVGFGELTKEYLVYQHEPRVDLRFRLQLNRITPRSIHTGIVVVQPESFDRETLAYTTVNGGTMAETFPLAGHSIRQDEPVRLLTSTKHCLGETEGWLNVADNEKGFSLLSWKDRLYSVSLLHYEETNGKFFFRVIPTISESDDVPAPTWWGSVRKDLSIIGHPGAFNERERRRLQQLSRGLVVVTR